MSLGTSLFDPPPLAPRSARRALLLCAASSRSSARWLALVPGVCPLVAGDVFQNFEVLEPHGASWALLLLRADEAAPPAAAAAEANGRFHAGLVRCPAQRILELVQGTELQGPVEVCCNFQFRVFA